MNAYLDGELAPHEAERLREHLSACPRCAEALEELKRLNHALLSLEGMEAPHDFAHRVRAAAEAAPQPVRHARVIRLRRALTSVAAALMAVAGLSVGMAMGWSVGRTGQVVADSTTSETTAFDIELDAFSAAPEGSVAQFYLAFTSEAN
jgi:anti-sigma factor RsiW